MRRTRYVGFGASGDMGDRDTTRVHFLEPAPVPSPGTLSSPGAWPSPGTWDNYMEQQRWERQQRAVAEARAEDAARAAHGQVGWQTSNRAPRAMGYDPRYRVEEDRTMQNFTPEHIAQVQSDIEREHRDLHRFRAQQREERENDLARHEQRDRDDPQAYPAAFLAVEKSQAQNIHATITSEMRRGMEQRQAGDAVAARSTERKVLQLMTTYGYTEAHLRSVPTSRAAVENETYNLSFPSQFFIRRDLISIAAVIAHLRSFDEEQRRADPTVPERIEGYRMLQRELEDLIKPDAWFAKPAGGYYRRPRFYVTALPGIWAAVATFLESMRT